MAEEKKVKRRVKKRVRKRVPKKRVRKENTVQEEKEFGRDIREDFKGTYVHFDEEAEEEPFIFGKINPETVEEYNEDEEPMTKYEQFILLSKKDNKDEPFGEFYEQLEKLPPLSWFTDGYGWEGVCDSLGYHSSTYTQDYFLDLFYLVAVFTRDFEEIDNMSDEAISQLVIDSVSLEELAQTGEDPPMFEEREDAIDYLKSFYEDVLTGENRRFYVEPNKLVEPPKERTKYVIDPEYVAKDLTDDEFTEITKETRQKLLANEDLSMPEIDEIDKELMDVGVHAVRDEKGRFVKGQKLIRKPKNIYSDKLPKLACDTCYKSGDCPEYKPASVCAYDKIFNRFDTRNMHDVEDILHSMVNNNVARTQRAMMFETMDGGIIDPTVTSLIDQNFNLIEKLSKFKEAKRQVMATQSRTLYADGTEETTSTVQGGVLSSFFEKFASEAKEKTEGNEEEDFIDAEFEESDE